MYLKMKKIKVKVETEKKGLFGKKKVTEYKTIEVDDKTYKRLMKQYNSRPYSLEEMMFYDEIFDD